MKKKDLKQRRKEKIKHRIKKKITGTAERPRLIPNPSNHNIYLQLIDDTQSHTLLGLEIKGKNKQAAAQAGKMIAEKAKKKQIDTIVFDRGGKRYHGVIQTISEEARKAGLKH